MHYIEAHEGGAVVLVVYIVQRQQMVKDVLKRMSKVSVCVCVCVCVCVSQFLCL